MKIILTLIVFILPLNAWAQIAYSLGVGDHIAVSIYDEPDLSGTFTIDSEGKITLPLVGSVAIAGLSLEGAEKRITEAYLGDYLVNPKISIQVVKHRLFYILGEVNRPGGYEYMNDMTLQNAVAIAGGFSFRAREDDIAVQRQGKKFVVQKEHIPSFLVLPGDVITIQERFF